MDLTIIVLALFSCISASSAGFNLFDEGKNQTYQFDGFTLDIPESAKVTYKNESTNWTYNCTKHILKETFTQ